MREPWTVAASLRRTLAASCVALTLLAAGCGAADDVADDIDDTTQEGFATAPLGCWANAVEGNIVTHWSNAIQGFSYGAVDAPPLAPAHVGSCFYKYGPAFLPNFEDYITDTYSKTLVSHATALATVAKLCTDSGDIAFRVVDPTGDVLSKLQEESGRTQIIHGLVVDGSFVSVILPPNWRKNAPTGTYPILFQGFYDVNDNLFGGFGSGQVIARLVAQSGVQGRTGAIGVVWNGGASVSAVTASPGARRQFASIIDLLANYAGADRHRILMFGASRGGVTTLDMASNPEHYNYTVTFAVAIVPGAKLGTHARWIGATVPAQVAGLAGTGFADSWRPGWTYPAGCGHADLVGLTAQQALSRTMLGSASFDLVDAYNSPISDSFVNGLQSAKTQLVLQFGSHDEYIPYGTVVEYLHKLRARGIPVEGHVVLRGGHTTLPGVYEERISAALMSYVQPGADPSPRTVASGSVRYYRVNRATSQPEEFTPPDGRIPFTLEVPKRLYASMPALILATGEPGTEFQVHTTAGALPLGVIGPTYTAEMVADTSYLAGTITYSAVYIRKPGADWKALDLTLTPSASGAWLTTEVVPGPLPAQSNDWVYMNVLRNTDLVPGWGGISWGVSEY